MMIRQGKRKVKSWFIQTWNERMSRIFCNSLINEGASKMSQAVQREKSENTVMSGHQKVKCFTILLQTHCPQGSHPLPSTQQNPFASLRKRTFCVTLSFSQFVELWNSSWTIKGLPWQGLAMLTAVLFSCSQWGGWYLTFRLLKD